jgi:hypothetical protein
MERIKNITNHPEDYAKKTVVKKFETTGLPPEAFRMAQKSRTEEGEEDKKEGDEKEKGPDVDQRHADK